MTERPSKKPRTIADVLASVHRAFDEAKHGRKPLPLPPPDAPIPPPSHHEGETDDHEDEA